MSNSIFELKLIFFILNSVKNVYVMIKNIGNEIFIFYGVMCVSIQNFEFMCNFL